MTTFNIKRKITRRLAALLGGVALAASSLVLPAQTLFPPSVVINFGNTQDNFTGTLSYYPSDFTLTLGNGSSTLSSVRTDANAIVKYTVGTNQSNYQGVQFGVAYNVFDNEYNPVDYFSFAWGPSYDNGVGINYPNATINNSSWASGIQLVNMGLIGSVSHYLAENSIDYGYNSQGFGGTEIALTYFTVLPAVGITQSGTSITLSWTTNFAGECNLAQTGTLLGTNTAWAVVTNTPFA